MPIELKEFNRILSIYKGERLSEKRTEYILERIFEESKDDQRKEMVEKYLSNKSQYIQDYSHYLGNIIKDCEHNLCKSCIINKWCNYYRNKMQREEEDREALTYADFFCGAGGLSWGFHKAGCKMSLANDIQSCCIDTISLNHPEVPEKYIVTGDIDDVLLRLKELSRYSHIDIVIGGPPCQGFSMANRQRLIDDPRNHLYKSFVKAINLLQPRIFVMENVRGILKVKEQIIQDFERIGYKARAYLLNAIDFGVPQNRERVIFIGNKIGIDNEEIIILAKSKGAENRRSVLRDVLDLPPLQAKKKPNCTGNEDDLSGYNIAKNKKIGKSFYEKMINEGRSIPLIYNHKARYNNERDIQIFSRLNPGDNSSDSKIADIMPYKRREKIFKDKYFKLDPDKPCKTITAHMKYDCNMYIHPFEARGLTPREAARIQSFPDDYLFTGPYTKTYMQIGNSVPPLLSEAIAQAIIDIVKQ